MEYDDTIVHTPYHPACDDQDPSTIDVCDPGLGCRSVYQEVPEVPSSSPWSLAGLALLACGLGVLALVPRYSVRPS